MHKRVSQVEIATSFSKFLASGGATKVESTCSFPGHCRQHRSVSWPPAAAQCSQHSGQLQQHSADDTGHCRQHSSVSWTSKGLDIQTDLECRGVESRDPQNLAEVQIQRPGEQRTKGPGLTVASPLQNFTGVLEWNGFLRSKLYYCTFGWLTEGRRRIFYQRLCLICAHTC